MRVWSAGILPAFVRPELVEGRLPFQLPIDLVQSPFVTEVSIIRPPCAYTTNLEYPCC